MKILRGANFCKALLRMCDRQIDESCLMCLGEFIIKENRKLKDEMKLLNAHMQQVIEECKELKSPSHTRMVFQVHGNTAEEIAEEIQKKMREQAEMLEGGY